MKNKYTSKNKVMIPAPEKTGKRMGHNMTKHTPGKCTCKALCDADGFYQDDEGKFCGSIAFCPLHAAAPELKNELRKLRDYVQVLIEEGRIEFNNDAPMLNEIMEDAEASLAKAEGRL